MTTISSPCIGVCTMDPKLQRCKGCWRTAEMLENWELYTEQERITIMMDLEYEYIDYVWDNM